jgi:hypothetical protein
VLQGGSDHTERYVGIYAGACSVMNEQYRACVTWSALKRVQASGNGCRARLTTGDNGDDSGRDPRECGVIGDTILRGDHDDAPNASGCRERLQRPAQCRLSCNGDE